MLRAVLLCLAALVGVNSAIFLQPAGGSVVEFPFSKQGGKIGGCDDCMSRSTLLHINPIYLNGKSYNAFAVHSNGYITLYNSTDDKVEGYSYVPSTNIPALQGRPIIAPFWADVDLVCPAARDNNTVFYEESNNQNLLYMATTIVMHNVFELYEPRAYWHHYGEEFDPQSLLIVTWNNVQSYDCPEEGETNRFQLVILTDSNVQRSYAIFFYRALGWISTTGPPGSSGKVYPRVGYADGQGAGEQLDLSDTPLATLMTGRPDYGIRAWEISEELAVTSNFKAFNKGNIVLQKFAEKHSDEWAEEQSDSSSSSSESTTTDAPTTTETTTTEEEGETTTSPELGYIQEEILLQMFAKKQKH